MVTRRYLTLDAMRGVAALTVFVLHAKPLILPIEIPRAYLAVDLFFLLSGFVIDHAYGAKLAAGMGWRRFMAARYVRLYPLYLLGTAIGILATWISLAAGQGVLSPLQTIVATVTALLMLPAWTADAHLVPVNFPAWSLLFELVANFVYALLFPRLSRAVLAAIAVLCLGGLCLVLWAHGSIENGPYWFRGWVGFLRVGYSFALGVLIQRAFRVEARVTGWAYLLPPALLLCFFGGGGLADLLKVALLFPALLLLAIRLEPPRAAIFAGLGAISYPLYALHIPIVQFAERVLTVLHIDKAAASPWAGIVLGLLLLPTALLADRLYDWRARAWLSARLGITPRSTPALDKGL